MCDQERGVSQRCQQIHGWASIRTGHAGNLNALRAQLDAVTFTTAWSEGRAMTFQQAVGYALNGAEDQEPV